MSAEVKAKEEFQSLLEEAAALIWELRDQEDCSIGIHANYQQWYSKALEAVELFGADRYEESRRFSDRMR
jgi:hypothetical protein